LGARSLNGRHDARRLVAAEVVHHHDVARAKRWDELLLDPGPEHTALIAPSTHSGATKPVERSTPRNVVVSHRT
jgi:hypothetical protein